MVLVNYSAKEINAKVVYYGPGLCGKTTNLEFIYGRVPQTNRGKMVSMKTRTERTLFFDFLPLNLGDLAGFQTRFLLYTVPGQIYYNATRKLVLKGVDALVFVADSGRGMMEENLESFQNLRDNLREHGLNLEDVPLVLQYNKRDLPDVYTVDELQRALNPNGAFPHFEAVATSGQGVFETFKGVARLLLAHLAKKMGIQSAASAQANEPTTPSTIMSAAALSAPFVQSPSTNTPTDLPRPSEPSSRGGEHGRPRPDDEPRRVPSGTIEKSDLVGARLMGGGRPSTEPVPTLAEPLRDEAAPSDNTHRTMSPPVPSSTLQQGAAALLQSGPRPPVSPAPPSLGMLEGALPAPSRPVPAPTGSRPDLRASSTERRTITVPLTLEANDLENGFVLELRIDVVQARESLRRAS
jgi:signal recognition particle receptor subunit beta